jgi:FMN phosphatase YigB (HAD superfamily)
LVELFDAGKVPGVHGYAGLYSTIRSTLDDAHMEGRLKEEILAEPDRLVVPDPDTVLALLDQRYAGKQLVLITNSEWAYTNRMMAYAIDPHIPGDRHWRDLFDAVVVSAAKPAFFTATRPFYRIVDETKGLMEPHIGTVEPGTVLVGGCAPQLEAHLRLGGDQILYVGDHLYSDVSVSKALLRWRTALILRELETEIAAAEAFASNEEQLVELMDRKVRLEEDLAHARLDRQRVRHGYAPPDADPAPSEEQIAALRDELTSLDNEISPLAMAAGSLRNQAWGPLMRSGNDKSLFARQVERYADVYTSRVSNFLAATPFAYLRADRGSLPHDR